MVRIARVVALVIGIIALADAPTPAWGPTGHRLAYAALDRTDRALALKFLVHLVGDMHQPFHAIGAERGGNGIPVVAFGSDNCSDRGGFVPCNLHGLWDSGLAARRGLNE